MGLRKITKKHSSIKSVVGKIRISKGFKDDFNFFKKEIKANFGKNDFVWRNSLNRYWHKKEFNAGDVRFLNWLSSESVRSYLVGGEVRGKKKLKFFVQGDIQKILFLTAKIALLEKNLIKIKERNSKTENVEKWLKQAKNDLSAEEKHLRENLNELKKLN
ncbi:MAG: hypothetical protein ABH821_00365 [archaeon]